MRTNPRRPRLDKSARSCEPLPRACLAVAALLTVAIATAPADAEAVPARSATCVALPSGATPTNCCPPGCGKKCPPGCIPRTLKHKPDRGFFRRTLDQVLGEDEDGHEPGLLANPTVAYAPETGWEFGATAVVVYYANDNVKNRLSEGSALAFFTEYGQYGLSLDHTIYTDHNTWFFFGTARAQSFPLKYYGVGDTATRDVKAMIEGTYTYVRERVLRAIVGSLYVGIELEFEQLSDANYVPERGYEDLVRPLGSDGSTSAGIGLGLIYDSCHNAMNVRDGVLAELGFLAFPTLVSTYGMTSVFTDLRVFKSTTQTQVLALQVNSKFTFGKVPFDEMALIGGPQIMRGFYTARYRDRNSVAAQLEYRFLPLLPGWRIGAAAFASIGSVSDSLAFKRWYWAAGGGPRVLLFPKKDIFIRVDFAWTREGMGTYLYMGEAF